MDQRQARKRLDAERARLDEIRTETQAYQPKNSPETEGAERSSADLHAADASADLFERERDESVLALVEHGETELDAAYARLEEGRYGLCEQCGGQIDEERLKAVPLTRYCREHQELHERRRGEPAPIRGMRRLA